MERQHEETSLVSEDLKKTSQKKKKTEKAVEDITVSQLPGRMGLKPLKY